MSTQLTDPDQSSALPSATRSAPAAACHTLRQWLISLGLLAALTLMMFADVFLPVFLALVGLTVRRFARRRGIERAWTSLRLRPDAPEGTHLGRTP